MADNYRIVVGVDGSPGGRNALRYAVQQAGRLNGTVIATVAWRWDGAAIAPIVEVSPVEAKARAQATLVEEIAAVQKELGTTIPITQHVVQGSADSVLTQTAADADLLVLGSHGHGRLSRAVLGSVSEECVRRATCAVVIIPATVHAALAA